MRFDPSSPGRGLLDRSPSSFLWIVGAALMSAGCPDPEGEFDKFADRYNEINSEGGGGSGAGGAPECTPAMEGEMDGKYLFTLSAKINLKKAFALDTTLTTHASGEGLTVDLSLQPLSSTDQTTPVGDPLEFTALPVNADGTFEWDLGTVTLVKDANPITPSDVEAELQLVGSMCANKPDFICGDANGTVLKPLNMYDLAGSHFTLQRYDADLPSPVINCAGDPAVYQ